MLFFLIIVYWALFAPSPYVSNPSAPATETRREVPKPRVVGNEIRIADAASHEGVEPAACCVLMDNAPRQTRREALLADHARVSVSTVIRVD